MTVPPRPGHRHRTFARVRAMPPLAQDLMLVAVLSAIQVLLLPAAAQRAGLAVLLVLESLPLVARRRAPLVTMALVTAIDVGLVLAGVPLQSIGASVVVAAYSAGAHQPRGRSLVTLVVGVLGLVPVVVLSADRTGNADRLGAMLVLVAAWWLGSSLRERREYAVEVERQAGELRVVRHELTLQAVRAERLRLAREMHDVVAHSLAVVALHSSVGAHNATQRPQDAVAALEAVNNAARTALSELRGLLTVLRDDPADETTTVDSPLPTLAELPALVGAAWPGLDVTLSMVGPAESAPRAVSLNAYRIVQEALTNVVRHAAPTGVRVLATVDSGLVRVEITNDANPNRTGEGFPGSGAGIPGMRERVAAFGGALDAGPTPTGGWRVVATIPCDGPGR